MTFPAHPWSGAPADRRVLDLLDHIDALFPPERLAASRERVRRLWAGEPPIDRLPWVAAPIAWEHYSAGIDPERALLGQLEEIAWRGRIDDDYIPALFPGCHQGTIPNMFGAREEVRGDDHSCQPLISCAAEAGNLPEPVLAEDSIARRWLDLQAFLVARTAGRLPVHVIDMQGPLDVCGKLWGYDDIFTTATEEPGAVAHLLRRACEAFLLLWRAQAELLGERFVGTHLFAWNWMPPGHGATASMDSLVMVSPAFFRRHVQPHLEWLAERSGGLCIHSCGHFTHMGRPLLATRGLTGLNAGQAGMADLAAAGFDGSVVLSGHITFAHLARDLAAVAAHRLRCDLTVDGLWRDSKPQDWDADAWRIAAEGAAQVNRAMAAVVDAWRADPRG